MGWSYQLKQACCLNVVLAAHDMPARFLAADGSSKVKSDLIRCFIFKLYSYSLDSTGSDFKDYIKLKGFLINHTNQYVSWSAHGLYGDLNESNSYVVL
jgi:hypothetical protein